LRGKIISYRMGILFCSDLIFKERILLAIFLIMWTNQFYLITVID